MQLRQSCLLLHKIDFVDIELYSISNMIGQIMKNFKLTPKNKFQEYTSIKKIESTIHLRLIFVVALKKEVSKKLQVLIIALLLLRMCNLWNLVDYWYILNLYTYSVYKFSLCYLY